MDPVLVPDRRVSVLDVSAGALASDSGGAVGGFPKVVSACASAPPDSVTDGVHESINRVQTVEHARLERD